MKSPLPLPPLDLRRTVGPTDPEAFDNPTGSLIFGAAVEASQYESFLDFGCGCGRTARQLIQQGDFAPSRYLGIDVNRAAIAWCQSHLTPVAPQFRFSHLNAWSAYFNPQAPNEQQPFPTEDTYSLVHAHSVFTHIVEKNLAFYFSECVRRLEGGGLMRATWFLFDKRDFPMMQEQQNCLYINENDPTNAAIYDVDHVRRLYRRSGLRLTRIMPPAIRGFQWIIEAVKEDGPDVPFPLDTAPHGLARPPKTIEE